MEPRPSERINGEVRTELISQFTSKMSEAAISYRKLEKMGFKGRKLEDFVDKSALRMRAENSALRTPSGE